ncbi:DUF881 domain-containing protein [Pseudofrankia inefficax]|uniref:DUF881 domain-containing protein n=1 Tax=Pseudofrankia inefficax (strain DSM 45817 / CECT 9037 / DDB 130130 / EuI1c) TaxID=298654 RepID=UPI001E490B25|nr:DUF881 domain-containing protein [Pseudofrankia inefficax]
MSGRLPGPLAAVAAQALDPAYPRARVAGPRSGGQRPGPAGGRPPGAAGRRGRTGVTGAGPLGRRAPERSPARLAAVAVAVGLLLAVAGVTQRAGAPGRARLDAALAAERDRGEAAVAVKTAEARGLRSTVAAARSALARDTATQRATADALGVLEPAAGATVATGPGLRVQIADAAGGDADAGPRGSGQRGAGGVTDQDLAAIVNALWAAHATAIAIDGVRLSGTSPIRTAGGAILVDFQPVVSPYRLDAIGVPAALLAAFFGSGPGRLLADGDLAGARLVAATTARVVTVPAAPVTTPRLARRLGQ